MKHYNSFSLFISLFLVTCILFACNRKETSVTENDNVVSISNEKVQLSFNLKNGTYFTINKINGDTVIRNACFSINKYRSDEVQYKHQYIQNEVKDGLGMGQKMQITSSAEGKPNLILEVTVYNENDFIVLNAGLKNTSDSPIQLTHLRPLQKGIVYPQKNKSENLNIIDGNGGGEPSWVYKSLPLFCRNNFLMAFGDSSAMTTLLAGGLTYTEFEKFTELVSNPTRRTRLSYNSPGELKAYLNLPVMREDGATPMLNIGLGYATQYQDAPNFELKHLIYNRKEIIMNILKPSPDKKYSIGFAWASDNDKRIQSIWADNGTESTQIKLTEGYNLPNYKTGAKAQQVTVNIPQELTQKGNVRIIIKQEGETNTIVQEAWLHEGWISEVDNKKSSEVEYKQDLNSMQLNLYAQDPVGRVIGSNQTYIPNDKFYLSFAVGSPFEPAEKYGNALKKAQNVELAYYTFPSVCLWYAMHPYYGDGPGMNNSIGAVEEMDQIVKSDFLKYSTVAVRLVPDCYEKNNEQGWWDDKYFQIHGSGNAVPGEVTVDAHYKAPYETTKKWASAIVEKGGIPLLYVQTGKRSQDFADTYPSQMLFNDSNAYIPDWNWTVGGKAGYDFTDKDFINHMHQVYDNFRESGLKGLMFDYTNTGWPEYGGMDDKTSTSTAAYRKIFDLAYNGMGKGAYIHERCLERGSDMTLGLVSSQRIWGDTDDVTPEMLMRGALRWYKNRVVVSYDMDAKNILKAKPADNPDGRRKLLTMGYVASGRLLLANSFARFNDSILYDLSRVYPFPSTPQSARPVDMFTERFPKIYDFKVNNQWHQVTLYNPDNYNPTEIKVSLSDKNYLKGTLELDSSKKYHVYDFWNDNYLGILSGNDILTQTLRPGEARMLSIREVIANPQVISTNRHIMQGYLDMTKCESANNKLTGTSIVPENEDYVIAIALNGKKLTEAKADKGTIKIEQIDDWIDKITIRTTEKGANVNWEIKFE